MRKDIVSKPPNKARCSRLRPVTDYYYFTFPPWAEAAELRTLGRLRNTVVVNDPKPYTRAELIASPAFPPERGELCPHCGMRIPQFADIADADMSRVLALLREGRTMMAIQELKAATTAPLAFAHLWVAHRGRPLPPEGDNPTPCPYCGRYLRSALAKQCRHCKRDWHDLENVKALR